MLQSGPPHISPLHRRCPTCNVKPTKDSLLKYYVDPTRRESRRPTVGVPCDSNMKRYEVGVIQLQTERSDTEIETMCSQE